MQNSGKIEHEGVISEISRDSVYVSILQQAACSDCHAKAMCSISEAKEKIIEIPDSSGKYKVGEKVIITGDSSIGLKAVLYAFVIPLILVVGILALGIHFSGSETRSALLTIIFLIIYYLILYFFRDNLKNKFIFTIAKTDD